MSNNKLDATIYPAIPVADGIIASPDWQLVNLRGVNYVPQVPFGPKQPQLNIAYIWLFFFGWLGIHRFYIGSIGLGLAYLFTFGFFGVGVIVDVFILQESLRKQIEKRRVRPLDYIGHN